jgi:hypothetical protein
MTFALEDACGEMLTVPVSRSLLPFFDLDAMTNSRNPHPSILFFFPHLSPKVLTVNVGDCGVQTGWQR